MTNNMAASLYKWDFLSNLSVSQIIFRSFEKFNISSSVEMLKHNKLTCQLPFRSSAVAADGQIWAEHVGIFMLVVFICSFRTDLLAADFSWH